MNNIKNKNNIHNINNKQQRKQIQLSDPYLSPASHDGHGVDPLVNKELSLS